MREIVHIQAGQCGNQVRPSLRWYDLVTCEHATFMCFFLFHVCYIAVS